ncbi:MAG: T9SS type A sorting domain-containing protein, partial [Cryomorphaceae bacterium]
DFWFVDEMIGYAIGISEMFKTEDGGLSWQLWSGPEDALGLRQILFISEQVGFLWNSATGASLYSTNDGGETWMDEQLSNIKVLERDAEYIYAAGNRGRIYRSPISALLNSSTKAITDAVRIYPNPARNHVEIQTGRSDWERIQIYDVTGSLVYESILESSIVHRLELDGFSSGIYLLSLIGKNNVSSGKLIVCTDE